MPPSEDRLQLETCRRRLLGRKKETDEKVPPSAATLHPDGPQADRGPECSVFKRLTVRYTTPQLCST